MLWRRTPRAVYRVYGEDEYLDDETRVEGDTNPTFGGEHASEDRHTATYPRPRGSRSNRFVGIGLLVGVIVCVLGLVVVNALHRPAVTIWSGFGPHTRNVPISQASTGPYIGVTVSAGTTRQRTLISRDGAPVKTRSSIDGAALIDHKLDVRASAVPVLTHSLPAAKQSDVSASSGAMVKPDQSPPSVSSGSLPEAASLVAEREFGFEQ